MAKTQTISTKELKDKLSESDKKGLFLDVREADEFNAEHIEGFENKPLSDIENWGKPLGEQVVYLSCQSGKRAGDAAEKLEALAPKSTVIICEESLKGWKESDQETVKPQTKKTGAPEKVAEPEKAVDSDKSACAGVACVEAQFTQNLDKFNKFSVERQAFFILGGLLILSLLLGSFGKILVLILGIMLLFAGFSGTCFLKQFLEGRKR